MASIINIPERHRDGFDKIFKIEDSEFASILDGLSMSSLTSSIRKIINQIALLKSLPFELVEKIFLSVGSIMSYLEKGDIAEDLAVNVFDIIVKNNFFTWAGEDNKERFVSRLVALLKMKQILYAAKGNSLTFEYQNVFLDARIATDFRPVFDLDVEGEPVAGLIIHNIHIHYQDGEESPHKDLYLALDSSDVKNLKELLVRAEKKELSLRSIIKKSGIENLNE